MQSTEKKSSSLPWIALAILAAIIKTLLFTGCAPDTLPADRAMRKHFPGFESSSSPYHDSLYQNLPTPQVNPRQPAPDKLPDWFGNRPPSVHIPIRD